MISRGSTALLLLDLQRDFMDEGGSRAAHVPVFASKFTIFASPSGAPLGLDHIVRARPFLLKEGFSAVILEDCVAAFDEELHLASLRSMGLYLSVIDSAAYLRALGA